MTQAAPMKRHSSIVLCALLTLAPLDPLLAKVAPARLSDVISQSEIILIGNVSSVISDSPGHRFAILSVEELWRGAAGPTLRVSVDRTWPCDSSDAIVGERAIFFLAKQADAEWHISHSGHGRMPIVDHDVSVSPMVILPDETRVRDTGLRRVPFQVMAFFVRSKLEQLGH